MTVVWYAKCLDVDCANFGSVVMRFNDQATREDWANRHRRKFTGHHIIRYIRRFDEEGNLVQSQD